MSDGNSQPTPEQDAANGTVSAANVTTIGEAPSVAAATPEFKLAAEKHFDAVREADEATGQDGTYEWNNAPISDAPAELAEALNELTPDNLTFVATSDEDAPNIGHVTYTEDEAPTSDTPVFDSTPGADDVSSQDV